MSTDDPFELEPPVENFKPHIDRRARMDEPLPVKLIAVADVIASLRAGVKQEQLDDFYVTMLGFQKESDTVYRSETFRLRFDPSRAAPDRENDFRPILIEIESLPQAEQNLIARQLDYERHKGLTAGTRSLVLLDPCGNWVQLLENWPV